MNRRVDQLIFFISIYQLKYESIQISTVILSFLERDHKREPDRDFMNVSDRDLVQYDRFRRFTVPDRS
jgi:hypothetical protein